MRALRLLDYATTIGYKLRCRTRPIVCYRASPHLPSLPLPAGLPLERVILLAEEATICDDSAIY
jgi:hypothetical protein